MPGFIDKMMGNASQNNQNKDDGQNSQNQNQNNQNQNQNSQNNGDDNNNNNNDSNNGNNVDNNTSIWDNDNNQQQQQQQNNNQQNQNNQNQNTESPSDIFDKHVASLNLSNGVDLSELQEQAAEGNFESLEKAFDTVAANTYKAALQQMNTIMDNKIATSIEKAVAESSSVMNENMALNEMRSALPFVADKDIAPVAEAALKQLMSKGDSVEKAIEKVQQFFQSTAEKVTGNNQQNQNNPINGTFNRNSNTEQNNSNNEEESWMEFLTNKG